MQMDVDINCKIIGSDIQFYTNGTTGTNENIEMYIRVNNTTDYLIETIGVATPKRRFNNNSMNIVLNAGDFYTVKFVCPTWATNPTSILGSGTIRLINL